MKKDLEGQSGQVEFASRETGGGGPRLALQLESEQTEPPSVDVVSPTSDSRSTAWRGMSTAGSRGKSSAEQQVGQPFSVDEHVTPTVIEVVVVVAFGVIPAAVFVWLGLGRPPLRHRSVPGASRARQDG